MATFEVLDDRLRHWMTRHRRVFALTGAGCSTASGIPDYRDDPASGRAGRQYCQSFDAGAVYRRYWARAMPDGPARGAEPNAAHTPSPHGRRPAHSPSS